MRWVRPQGLGRASQATRARPLPGRRLRSDLPRGAHAATGDLDCTDFPVRRGNAPPGPFLILLTLVHGRMDLAPNPGARPTMPARMPFADPADLDAGAVHCPAGHCQGQCPERGSADAAGRRSPGKATARPASSGVGRASRRPGPASRAPRTSEGSQRSPSLAEAAGRRAPRSLSGHHCVMPCRAAVRQAWIAASPWTGLAAPLARRCPMPRRRRVEPTSRDIAARYPAGQWTVSDPRLHSAAS